MIIKKRDSRIIVIHKENGGVSSARNQGLDIAKGDYIGFVDGDDLIKPNMYEVLVKLLEEENAGYCTLWISNGVSRSSRLLL